MAILEKELSEISGGFEKHLDENAIGMLMENFQSSQYQFPIKSSIREIASNAVDSIRERDIAKDILSGTSLVSDHYEEREGNIYKDSKFVPEYYNLDWLSDDPNVYITYLIGEGTEKDKIVIKDNGVGLGSYRLERYFDIGYSTKRLSKAPLGKFGIGAKSPLSINAYYTMESRYNGKVFRFNVYSSKVESIIGKFNLTTELENESYTLANGYVLYYETTEEKNGVTITIDCKKHYQALANDAVQSQLLYFDNIVYKVNNDTIDFKANIIYEDEFIIMSDSKYYSKPHLLLNKVNYGYIDFEELEQEEKSGNIGIKVQPEDVDISPSREHLIWKDRTRETVTKRFKQVVNIATTLVQQELQETDFLRWLKSCYSINAKYNGEKKNGSIIERLSMLVDLSAIEPYFSDTKIRFSHFLFDKSTIQMVTLRTTSKHNQVSTKIVRDDIYSLASSANYPVILDTGRASNRKDKYLVSLYSQFIRFQEPVEMPLSVLNLLEPREKNDYERKFKVWELLKTSKDVLFYDKIEVPEDFGGSDLEEEIEEVNDVEEAKIAKLSKEERRKLEGKVVLFTPRWGMEYGALLEWQKIETPTRLIDEWNESEIYYGNDADAQTLKFVTYLTRDTVHEAPWLCRAGDNGSYNKTFDGTTSYTKYSKVIGDVTNHQAYRCTHFVDNSNIKIIKVSQQTTKLYKDFYHINKFFHQIKNGTLTMSNTLIEWNTARLLKQHLHKLAFLYNYSVDIEKQTEYRKLLEYFKNNYRDMEREEFAVATGDLINHLDKVQQFQMFVLSNNDPDAVSKLALELWKTDQITDACSIDMTIYNRLNNLLDWSEPIRTMFNEIPVLTGLNSTSPKELKQYTTYENNSISEDLERVIISYVESKFIS